MVYCLTVSAGKIVSLVDVIEMENKKTPETIILREIAEKLRTEFEKKEK